MASVLIESQAAPIAAVQSRISCVSFIRFSVDMSTENMALKNETVFSKSTKGMVW